MFLVVRLKPESRSHLHVVCILHSFHNDGPQVIQEHYLPYYLTLLLRVLLLSLPRPYRPTVPATEPLLPRPCYLLLRPARPSPSFPNGSRHAHPT